MKKFIFLLALIAAGAWYADRTGWIQIPYIGSGASSTGARQAGPGGRRGPGARAEPPVPVIAVAVKTDDVPVTLDAVGTVQALESVTVHAQVSGQLLELLFSDGQDVKKGDVLARIDSRTYQAQYDSAVAKKAQDEALLANARIDLDRYARLAATNFGSKQQSDTQRSLVDQLAAQIKADQAAIDNAKTTLDYATVRAPIDGRTGIRAVDAGNIVQMSDVNGIVTINRIMPISVVFSLPQQQLAALRASKARGDVPAQALEADNATLIEAGKIEVIDNLVDQTTGSVRVKATFPNASQQLWPGQFVNMRVLVDTLKGVTVVPTSAVQRGPTGPYVYVVVDNTSVKKTDVIVGRQDEQTSVIKSGVTPSQMVVTTGFARISDGSKVAPSTPEESQPRPAADAPPQQRRGQRRGEVAPPAAPAPG